MTFLFPLKACQAQLINRLHFTFFQRGQIYKIKKVDAFVKPNLFTLEDLLNTEVKGKFYEKQLRVAPNAEDPDFIFEVEKVEKRKVVKGKQFLFVKYLYYPAKFNQWIPSENIVIDND